jgi:outer membrane cobalamin receptor
VDWKLLNLRGMNQRNQASAHFPNTVRACVSVSAAGKGRGKSIVAVFIGFCLIFRSGAASDISEAEQASDMMSLSLEQLLEVNVDKVYGASKYEQQVTLAPASVSLITRDEIQKHGYRTLADVLRTVNGVYVTDDRNYSYIGMRGFNRPGDYNSRVLLLVDGHRINDNIYDQGLYGREGFLDVDLIERVEVVRGPSSSIYGNNAFFGVVNVLTRRGSAVNGLETTGEIGDNDTYKGGVTYGKEFGAGVELLLSGSFYDSAGEGRVYFPEFDTPATNNGMAENSDGERAYQFFSSLRCGELTLSGGWSWRRRDIPTASFGTEFNDGGELTDDARSYADLKWEHDFTDAVKFIGRVAYDYSWYHGEYPYGVGVGRVLNLDEGVGESVCGDWQVNWQALARCKLVLGGDFRENLTMRQENWDEAPFALYLNDEREGRNLGAFAQAEINLLTNLVFNAGGRFDYYSTFGETVNPRLALIYAPWTATTFKALYGEAYRAPNAYELYYAYPGQSKANPNLHSEEIRTYELVWEQGLPANLRFSVAAYHYEGDDLTMQVLDPGDGLLVFQNLDSATANGVEFGLEGRYKNGLTARVGYALQRTENSVTDLELSNSPRQLGKLSLTAPLWQDKLWAGLDLQYSSSVRTLLGNESDDVIVVNATLFARPLGPNWDFSASLYNLFDERDGYSGSNEHIQDTIPLAGRSFRVKITGRF